MDVQQVWQDTLDAVRGELNTATFKTWFEQTSPLGIVEHEMLVGVHNDFALDWIESRYSGLLASALTQVTGSPMVVRFSVLGATTPTETTVEHAPTTPEPLPVVVSGAPRDRGSGARAELHVRFICRWSIKPVLLPRRSGCG